MRFGIAYVALNLAKNRQNISRKFFFSPESLFCRQKVFLIAKKSPKDRPKLSPQGFFSRLKVFFLAKKSPKHRPKVAKNSPLFTFVLQKKPCCYKKNLFATKKTYLTTLTKILLSKTISNVWREKRPYGNMR